MKSLDWIAGFGLLALGLLQAGVGFLRPEMTIEVLWAMSAGLAAIFLAALNLLRLSYAALVPALGWVCFVGNGLMLALAAALGLRMVLLQRPLVLLVVLLLALLVHFSLKQMMTFRTPAK